MAEGYLTPRPPDVTDLGHGVVVKRVGMTDTAKLGRGTRWVDAYAVFVDGNECQPWLPKAKAIAEGKAVVKERKASAMGTIRWYQVERIMVRCVRGAGYVPTTGEADLLSRALKANPDEYKRRHEKVKAEAAREVCP